MVRLAIVILVFSVSVGSVMADGKVYIRDKIPSAIPYQRAVLFFDAGRETLLLQSKYQTSSEKSLPLVGWVVPVPAVPELGSMDVDLAESLFYHLDHAARPEVKSISGILGVYGALLAIVVTLMITVISFLPQKGSRFKKLKENRWTTFNYCVIALFGELFLLYVTLPSVARTRGIEMLVDEIKAERVGIYDVKVIRGKNSTDLIAWLKENKFQYDKNDTKVFDDYIKRNWCFVVANIRASEKDALAKLGPQGLVNPLILRFPVKQPVYPLALTAIGGHDTLIHLYVVGTRKVQCDAGLPLWYAGTHFPSIEGYVTEPIDLISTAVPNQPYMTVFKGTLTPEQMRKDAYLPFAPDDEYFRSTVYRW